MLAAAAAAAAADDYRLPRSAPASAARRTPKNADRI